MSTRRRLRWALGICLSGLLLMPVIPLATEIIDWQLFGGAYLFDDGFESGDTSAWSSTTQSNGITVQFPRGSRSAEAILATISTDRSCLVPAKILPGSKAAGELLVFDCRFLMTHDGAQLTFRLPDHPVAPELP